MVAVRRIVLDVLKPHEPELVTFAEQITELAGVAAVNVAVIEIDREVQNVKLTVEGEALDDEPIQAAIQELGRPFIPSTRLRAVSISSMSRRRRRSFDPRGFDEPALTDTTRRVWWGWPTDRLLGLVASCRYHHRVYRECLS